MKTLKQIIEGVVVTSDFKLDRKGRKYKAHRMSMGDDMKEDSNPYTKVYEEDTFTKTLPRMGNKALDTAKGLISPYEKAMSDMSPGSDYYKKNIENNPEAKAKVDDFMKSAPKASELDSSIDKTKQKFNKALTNKGTVGDSVEEDTSIMNTERSKVLARFIKSATPKNGQVVYNVDTSGEVSEARGRPAGAATLAKRAAAASKPREDDEEGEHYEADSGVEADQHIHVQLKKAADSDQKPFEVSFKNGKKHTVSQKVAKDILSATERLKPEHRKNVHDEIHHSYDNLMSVHRLVARK